MLGTLKARLAAQRGAAAETRAEAHLAAQGLRPVARNWRCAVGELDVVMAEGATLVVVEVRARQSASHGSALESVDTRKRHKLARATQAFLLAHPAWQDAPVRFDIVHFGSDGKGRWLRAAFTLDDLA